MLKVAEREAAFEQDPDIVMLRDEMLGFRAHRLFIAELILRAKLPTELSPFVGEWRDGVAYYKFHPDGTFRWRAGVWALSSSGKWMDVEGRGILLCYDDALEKGQLFSVHTFATIAGDTLKVDQYDYTNDYVRVSATGGVGE